MPIRSSIKIWLFRTFPFSLTHTSWMERIVEDDCRHNPCQPDWNGHSHEDADVLWLAIVVTEVPGLDGQAADKEDEKDDVEKCEKVIPGGVGAEWRPWREPLNADHHLQRSCQSINTSTFYSSSNHIVFVLKFTYQPKSWTCFWIKQFSVKCRPAIWCSFY